MRGLAIFLFAALLLAAAVVMLDLSLGNLTLWLPPYRIDMSLQLALFSLLIIFVGLVVLALLVIQLASIPARVRRFRLHRAQNQRLGRLAALTIDYFEGRFARVVKESRNLREDTGLLRDSPAALAAADALAASAAHQLRDTQLRDALLAELRDDSVGSPRADTTLAALLEAEFALDDHRGLRALSALAPLIKGDRRNVHTLRLALKANQQQGNWDEVLRIGRLLENRRAISAVLATEIKREVVRAWITEGRHIEAIALIESALKKEWDSGLAMLYGRAEGNAREQLQRLDAWLRDQPRDAELNWSMGRICQRQALWGKARMHFETSLRIKPMVAAHVALAEVAERLDEKETAASHWKAAARMTA
ncbi:MAG: heme biosynthesis HemY N-terminal domain-containing protein [Burkholderiaceae bacterium]|jgi:HemY protein